MLKNTIKGFTIIESMIAMLVLVIMMTGGMAFYNLATKHAAESTHEKIALELADSEMERVRSSALTEGSTTNPSVPIGYLTGSMTTNVTVDSGIYKVDVQVDWAEPGIATPRQVVLQTYVSP